MAQSHRMPDEVQARIVERLRIDEPTVQAVLLCGSFARNEGTPFSDIDILVLTEGEPNRADRTWLEADATGRRFHVSVGAESIDEYGDEELQAAAWAMGFPVIDVMRVLWTTEQGRSVVGDDPTEMLPGVAPELEDFAELFMKVRRAARDGDSILLRWSARMLAEYSVGLALPFNHVAPVRSAAEALSAALAFADALSNYADRFRVCWGLVPATDGEIVAAATLLQQEAFSWLRTKIEGRDFPADDAHALLLDGSLQRYLESD